MDLRPELTPPPLPAGRLDQIMDSIEKIQHQLESGDNANDQIQAFNSSTGRTFNELMFLNYWRSMDLEDFARMAARPAPHPVDDITAEELVEIVRRAMPKTGNSDYEYYMEIFDANVPMPKASNLIFYPIDYDAASNTWGGGKSADEYNLTPAEIVAQALVADE